MLLDHVFTAQKRTIMLETYSWYDEDNEGATSGIALRTTRADFRDVMRALGVHVAYRRCDGDFFTDIVRIEETLIYVRTSRYKRT